MTQKNLIGAGQDHAYGYGGYAGQYSGSTTYSKCHSGVKEVFVADFPEGGRVTVTAGGSSRSGNWYDGDIIPDLVIGPESTVRAHHFPSPKDFKVASLYPTFLPLVWPDRSVPFIPVAFWRLLIEDIRTHAKKRGNYRVHVMCMGGHGRTGVSLAIIYQMIFQEFKTVDELVGHCRKIYCDHIVETKSQMDYIGKIVGIPYKEELKWSDYSAPTKSYGTGTAYTPQAAAKLEPAAHSGNGWGLDMAVLDEFGFTAAAWKDGSWKKSKANEKGEVEHFAEHFRDIIYAASACFPARTYCGYEKESYFLEATGQQAYIKYESFDDWAQDITLFCEELGVCKTPEEVAQTVEDMVQSIWANKAATENLLKDVTVKEEATTEEVPSKSLVVDKGKVTSYKEKDGVLTITEFDNEGNLLSTTTKKGSLDEEDWDDYDEIVKLYE